MIKQEISKNRHLFCDLTEAQFHGPGAAPTAKSFRGGKNPRIHTKLDCFSRLRDCIYYIVIAHILIKCALGKKKAPQKKPYNSFPQVLWGLCDGNVLVHTKNQASDVQQDESKPRSLQHDGPPPGFSLCAKSSVVAATFRSDQTQRFCQTCVATPAQNENTPVSFFCGHKKFVEGGWTQRPDDWRTQLI